MDKQLRWLYQELPQWVADGILTEEAAERLRLRYGEPAPKGTGWGSIIWMTLAAVLIVLGAVLLLSEQWYGMTREMRFGLLIGLVLVSQAFVAIVAGIKPQNTAWRETAGIFHGLAFIGAMYLVADLFTMNPNGEWKLVLMTSLFLLPSVYALRSVSLASIYAFAAASFAVATGNVNAWFGEYLTWFLLLAGVPYFFLLYKDGLKEKELLLYGWCFGLTVYFTYFVTLSNEMSVALAFFALMATLTLLLGLTLGRDKIWGIPFRVIGGLAMVGAMLNATFRSSWVQIADADFSVFAVMILVLLLFVMAGIIWRLYRRRDWEMFYIAIFPFLVAIGTFISGMELGYTFTSLVMMTYYILVTLWILAKGIRRHSLWYTDIGLLMAGAFILMRLMDSMFSPWERGIAFLAVGGIILVLHFILSRRRKKTPPPRKVERRPLAAEVKQPEELRDRRGRAKKPMPFVPSERATPKIVTPPPPSVRFSEPVPTFNAGETEEFDPEMDTSRDTSTKNLRWQEPPQKDRPHFGGKGEDGDE